MDKTFTHSSYSLFESDEAHGHNHFLSCIAADSKGRLTGIMINYEPMEEEIAQFNTPEGRVVSDWTIPKSLKVDQAGEAEKHCFDSIWMLHVAVNLYNENGLFSDRFPLINTMVSSGEVYSFFGRKYQPLDFTDASLFQKSIGIISRFSQSDITY